MNFFNYNNIYKKATIIFIKNFSSIIFIYKKNVNKNQNNKNLQLDIFIIIFFY